MYIKNMDMMMCLVRVGMMMYLVSKNDRLRGKGTNERDCKLILKNTLTFMR